MIYQYWEGYYEARQKVMGQTFQEDLELLDLLFGRDNLRYGATPKEVKREALRQLEIEWRQPCSYQNR